MRFRNYVLSNFPFLEDDFDALTDYQLFCKMIGYMKKMSKQFDEFKVKLDQYENYFNNLDVQEEIDNKLDEMYESGDLANIVAEFLALKSTFVYDTVADLKLAENLADGCTAKTLGYNAINDGGDGFYYIREIDESDTIDNIFTLSLYDNNLVAVLIIDKEVNVKQSGLSGLSTEDATTKLSTLVASGYDLYFPTGIYTTTAQLSITCHSIRGDGAGKSIIKYIDENNNDQLIECTTINDLTLEGLTFDCGIATDETKTAINIYDGENIKITNCELKNGYGSHLRLNGSNNILIENCDFHDISGTTGNMGNAIYCHPVSNLTIRKCRCNNLMENFLYLDGASDESPVKNVLVDNCYLQNTSHNNESTVSNCIGINGYCENVTVSNCVLINNGASIRCQGRYGYKPNNVFIYGNRCSDNIQNGLNITADNVFIHDNIVYNCGQDGIYILSSDNVNLNNNIIHNSNRHGIWCRGSNHLMINGNRIYDNTSGGLILGTDSDNPCNYVTITNNEIYRSSTGTQGTGIQMLYGDDVKVNSCHVYNNTVNWDMHRVGVTNYVSQLNPAYNQSGVNSIVYGTTIPVNGTYNLGDIILYKSPSAGGHIGAVCVTAGTPGTWKEFGSISS